MIFKINSDTSILRMRCRVYKYVDLNYLPVTSLFHATFGETKELR